MVGSLHGDCLGVVDIVGGDFKWGIHRDVNRSCEVKTVDRHQLSC